MSGLKRAAIALSLAVALVGAGGASTWAQEHHEDHHGGPGGHPGFRGGPGFHGGFHGHDFAHFTPAERAAWVAGGWHHEWRNGRFGWWWAVGGIWYFYDTPIYPYPDYVADIYYDPSMGAEPVAGSPPGYWYYCAPSGAYYPYVQTCPVPWTPVAPTPPSQ